MERIISLKELRLNMQKYADKTQKGESFVVVKQSKPVFKITPVEETEIWEKVIDFTEIKKGGIKIEELLKRL